MGPYKSHFLLLYNFIKPTKMQEIDLRTPQEIAKELAYGQTLKFTLPSGYWVKIREQNGNDDDILSNRVNAKDMTNFNMFLTSLIIDTNLPFSNNGRLNLDNINNLLIRDKYYIIIRSRIHSIGNILKIEFDWGEKLGGKIQYEEDLERYIWDYENEFPEVGNDLYDKEKIEPYILEDPYVEQNITLKSGKNLKFKLYNGYSEVIELLLPESELTRNSSIKARHLQELVGDKWLNVENFSNFKPKEMVELKGLIKLVDPPFRAMTELKNPNTDEVFEYPILSSVDFFYPEEI